MSALRNIAIIAHVDHGKTTLVDCLLKQSGTFRANEAVSATERITGHMDRGIFKESKNTPEVGRPVCTPLPVEFKFGSPLHGAGIHRDHFCVRCSIAD